MLFRSPFFPSLLYHPVPLFHTSPPLSSLPFLPTFLFLPSLSLRLYLPSFHRSRPCLSFSPLPSSLPPPSHSSLSSVDWANPQLQTEELVRWTVCTNTFSSSVVFSLEGLCGSRAVRPPGAPKKALHDLLFLLLLFSSFPLRRFTPVIQGCHCLCNSPAMQNGFYTSCLLQSNFILSFLLSVGLSLPLCLRFSVSLSLKLVSICHPRCRGHCSGTLLSYLTIAHSTISHKQHTHTH